MNESRPRLTTRLVWTLMTAGCNANEISAYAGVTPAVVLAMMSAAARKQTERKAKPLLKRTA